MESRWRTLARLIIKGLAWMYDVWSLVYGIVLGLAFIYLLPRIVKEVYRYSTAPPWVLWSSAAVVVAGSAYLIAHFRE